MMPAPRQGSADAPWMGSRELELMDGSKRVQNRAGEGVGVGGAFPRLWLALGPGVCWVPAVRLFTWPVVWAALGFSC